VIQEPQEKESATNDEQWIVRRVAEACEKHPLVTSAVSSSVESLLKDELSEKLLSVSRLTGVARSMIENMPPARLEVGALDENKSN